MSSVWEAVQKSLPGWWCGTIRRCRRRSPCDEHREVAVPGAGVRCAEEPLGPYRRLPRVGYVAVANHDLLRSKLGEVGAIAQLLPAHRRARVNVLAVEDHVLVSTLARHGISAIENPKLRWPEAGELRAPEPMPPQAQPTVDGLWPAGVGDQRQQGMGFPRTDRRNHMRTGQQAPLTSSHRLCDERLGRAHVRDSIDAVAEVPRCRAVAAWRLQACA